jgi:transcriptional regulator with XRE-family HTH domain
MVEIKQIWKNNQIRTLRLRLGWTQSDLARRLQCEAKLIESLELGNENAAVELMHKLELISHQADLCENEMRSLPAAESFCDQERLGQVELNKVREN